MRTLIVVPARYGSTRFLGKPLAEINGISMVRRTARIAQKASEKIGGCDYVVATDHEEIKAHCQTHNIPALMTDKDLSTGSCLLYTSPSPRDRTRSRMPSSA